MHGHENTSKQKNNLDMKNFKSYKTSSAGETHKKKVQFDFDRGQVKEEEELASYKPKKVASSSSSSGGWEEKL